MARINPVEENTNTRTRELLGAVQKRMGMVPNMVATMAQSPVVAKAYLDCSQLLGGGSLSAQLRQQISLVVSETDQCEYCVSGHSFLGSKAGLDESEILDARHGTSHDARTSTALAFARKIVEDRGHLNDEDVEEVRRAGFSDGEIVEIIANVCMTVFTNYFNNIAGTEIDFPVVPLLMAV